MKLWITTLIILLTLCVNSFAIEPYEAEKFIGKEAEVLLTIKYKNNIRYIPLELWIIDVYTIGEWDYVAVKGDSDIPFLVPCANIKRIRKCQ
jgi:hypothetical protein